MTDSEIKTVLIVGISVILLLILWINWLYVRSRGSPEERRLQRMERHKDIIESMMMTFNLAKGIRAEEQDIRNMTMDDKFASFEIVHGNYWVRCYADWYRHRITVQDYSGLENNSVHTLNMKIKHNTVDLFKLFTFFACDRLFNQDTLNALIEVSAKHKEELIKKYGSIDNMMLIGVLPRIIQKLDASNPDDQIALTMFFAAFDLDKEIDPCENENANK